MPDRLNTLVVENFRSIRGKVVIPLDAQVVLINTSDTLQILIQAAVRSS
jgi:DNA repair protein SbcC/Rad50